MLSARGLQVTAVGLAREALKQLELAPMDVVICDLGLPDLDGVDLIQLIRGKHPHLPIVVLTIATSEARIMAALRAGAVGYLFKEDIGSRLASAIIDAFDGGAPMSPAVAQLVLSQIRAPHVPPPSDDRALTPREREVIDGMARGMTYDEVASSLGVRVNTIRSHIRSIYEKLDASTKTEAVMTALRRGLLTS
jgi:DNA-binding NarL/FixJ family response regulator